MKKTFKRTLAILLAALILLSGASVAAAAVPANAKPGSASGTNRQFRRIPAATSDGFSAQGIPAPSSLILSVKTPPDDTTYLLGMETPELSGLVVTINMGGTKFDAEWNKGWGRVSIGNKEIYWELWIDRTELPTTPGSANVIVHCYCESYDYNTFSYRSDEGTLAVSFTALSVLGLKTGETPIVPGTPLDWTLTGAPDQFQPDFFVFTPTATGLYTLTASGYPNATSPLGVLLTSDGAVLGTVSYDLDRQPLQYLLQAGETYYFAVDYVYYQTPVSPYGLTLKLTTQAPSALSLDVAKPLAVSGDGRCGALLTFTPTQSGDYCFRSQSGNWDLYAKLFDDTMKQVAANDDGGTRYLTRYYGGWLTYSFNFKISYTLQAGKTYYLSVANVNGDAYENDTPAANDASVLVEKCYLRGARDTVKAYYEGYIPFAEMFETNYDEIYIDTSPGYFGVHKVYDPRTVSFWYDFVPIKIGSTTVFANPTINETVTARCNVRVTYNWWQWLLVIFCFAWIWM